MLMKNSTYPWKLKHLIVQMSKNDTKHNFYLERQHDLYWKNEGGRSSDCLPGVFEKKVPALFQAMIADTFLQMGLCCKLSDTSI